MIKITDPKLTAFYKAKPDFDILAFDFTRQSNCNALLADLDLKTL